MERPACFGLTGISRCPVIRRRPERSRTRCALTSYEIHEQLGQIEAMAYVRDLLKLRGGNWRWREESTPTGWHSNERFCRMVWLRTATIDWPAYPSCTSGSYSIRLFLTHGPETISGFMRFPSHSDRRGAAGPIEEGLHMFSEYTGMRESASRHVSRFSFGRASRQF